MLFIIYSPQLNLYMAKRRGHMTTDAAEAYQFTNAHLAWVTALEMGQTLGHAMQVQMLLQQADPAEAAAKQTELLQAMGVGPQAAAQAARQVNGLADATEEKQ